MQLEAELEEYKLVRRPEVVEHVGNVLMVTAQKTLSMKRLKTNIEGQIQILETKFDYAEMMVMLLLCETELQLVKLLLFKLVP